MGRALWPALLLVISLSAGCSAPADRVMILATTTSTQDSGLLDVLVPRFEQESGYQVKTIAVGSGRALAMGEKGEADVLLVHAPDAEMRLVESGAVVNRRRVMHNDFVLAGPPNDPAGIGGTADAAAALARIARAQAPFFSRGDDSGTHQLERKLWAGAGIAPGGAWYQETGSGMGQTLRVAAERQGYVLADRATYLSLRGALGLAVLVEGDPVLFNVYHVMQVNPQRFEQVDGRGGAAFVRFMAAESTRELIAGFGVDRFGQPLFVPDRG